MPCAWWSLYACTLCEVEHLLHVHRACCMGYNCLVATAGACFHTKQLLKVNRMVLLRLVLFRLQVKKVESYGSGSGRTSKKIVIADCGQLS